jgi:hypothetical protein
MKENAGMKLIAKILLNSLWGKFAQRDDLPTTQYFTDPSKWFKLLDKHSKGELVIKNETMIDENTLYVQYISKSTDNSPLNTTNLGLGAMVTAQARLRLYSELYKLDKRVIYCDTDSIIYKYIHGEYNIPEGDLLGQWENETKSPICEVKAIAPKTYGYLCVDYKNEKGEIVKGKCESKCKGITLHFDNHQKFNFEKIDELLKGETIFTKKLEFIKDNKKGTITSKDTIKKITFNKETFKRIINSDNTTSARF